MNELSGLLTQTVSFLVLFVAKATAQNAYSSDVDKSQTIRASWLLVGFPPAFSMNGNNRAISYPYSETYGAFLARWWLSWVDVFL